MSRPFSQACENNKRHILDVIRNYFTHANHVLKIGSGTGQHAVFFGAEMPHLKWQTSDLKANHPGILEWISQGTPNILPPVTIDVRERHWPVRHTQGIFSANTAHIMSWSEVHSMFAGCGRVLLGGGYFCLYGPFNFNGKFTSDSNEAFDAMLRERDPDSGIREFTDLLSLARHNGLQFVERHRMPANNQLLVWQKPSQL